MDGMSAGCGFEIAPELDHVSAVDELPGLAASVLGRVHQRTLRNSISCTGVGLHGGVPVTLTLRPGVADQGIVFRRVDLGIEVAARFDHVVDTRLCTVLAPDGHPEARIATIEHVMAALSACGIDNAVVELDGPEVPVLDGSSAPFVFLIDCAGRAEQDAPRGTIEVLKPIRV